MTKMFNVRVEDDLLAAIESKAAETGVTKSVWAREVLASVAYGLIELTEVKSNGESGPHPARFLALQSVTSASRKMTGACLHPVSAYVELPFTTVCRVCGAVVRQK